MTLHIAYRYAQYARNHSKPYHKFQSNTAKAFLDVKKWKHPTLKKEIVDVITFRDIDEGFSLGKLNKALLKDVFNKDGEMCFYYSVPFDSMPTEHLGLGTQDFSRGLANSNIFGTITRSDNAIDLMFNCAIKLSAPLCLEDHANALSFLKNNLRPGWSLKRTTRQAYKNLENGDKFYSELLYDNLNKYKIPFQTDKGPLDVIVPLIELIDMVQVIAVHPGHPSASDLLRRSIINPITGEKLPIITEDEIVDKTSVFGLVPGHFTRDSKLAGRHPEIPPIKTAPLNQFMFKRLQFARKLGVVLNKYESKHTKSARSMIYPFLSHRMILTDGVKSFPITKDLDIDRNCHMVLALPILETIISVQRHPDILLVPNLTGVKVTLEAMNYNKTIVHLPNIVNSKGNSAVNFRRDLHVLKSSKSFDQLLSASKSNPQIHANSADQIRGMLLDVNEHNTVVFDDYHRSKHFIKLNLLSYLLTNYLSHFKPDTYGSNTSFQFDFNKVLNMKDFPRHDKVYKDITAIKLQTTLLTPWNAFIIRSIFDRTISFEKALKEGNIAMMNQQFDATLSVICHNYIDLLMAEILINCEKKENGTIWRLAKEKMFLKDLLGSCILSVANMAKYFYPQLANYIRTKAPCQKDKFRANLDIYRKIRNREIEPNLRYQKLLDDEFLQIGKLMLDLNGLLKQIFANRSPSDAEVIHIVIHVKNNLRKFLFLGENWPLLKLVFRKFKRNWKGSTKLRLFSEYESSAMVIHETFELSTDVRVHVAYASKPNNNSKLILAIEKIKTEAAQTLNS
ncbi:BA75_01046T0 [Komagataella pastoris]|uniref:BA75_01046T0 n=1 Tax=Komagataella pastoris TaxID=4922 RepID=A0A1B2J5K3_PICPA|nr:BA75_01046T0 [Komagataella pastoris]